MRRNQFPPKDQPVLPAEEFKPPPYADQVEAAATEYYRTVRNRISLAQEEADAYGRLVEIMKFHGCKEYRFNGFEIVPGKEPKLVVKITEDAPAESDPNQTAIDGTVHDDDMDEAA